MKKFAIVLAAVGLFCDVPLSLEWSQTSGPVLSLESAQARVGRPATPASAAGVARRTTRRTVATTGAAVAPVRRAVVYCTRVGYPVGCVAR
jgi:hypothetical protein